MDSFFFPFTVLLVMLVMHGMSVLVLMMMMMVMVGDRADAISSGGGGGRVHTARGGAKLKKNTTLLAEMPTCQDSRKNRTKIRAVVEVVRVSQVQVGWITSS